MALPKTSATIANGTSDSDAIPLGNFNLVGIEVPTITNAGLTIRASDDGGTTYRGVWTSAGELTYATGTGNKHVVVNPNDLIGCSFIKLRSGTDATPVNQGADRVFTLIFREKR